jgi:tyrosine-specific transport protein
MSHTGTVFKGSLLVAGTAIGAGMLALPVLTSLGGFFPSLVIYLGCWFFMACTGLLILEASQWMREDANLVTMAETTLGFPGKVAAWVLYIFLFYCLSVAYVVGCGGLLHDLLQAKIPDWAANFLFVIIFAPFIYTGSRLVGKLNVFLMIGLAISYLAFVWIGYRYVDFTLLKHTDWPQSLRALPIAFTAFAYQGIVPTLKTYMGNDIPKTRNAILIGSFLPLIAYIIWQGLILGIVPVYGPGGLAEALQEQTTAVEPLKYFIQNPYIYLIGQAFAFFALVTSFLGVALGLKDFLADGLSIHKDPRGRLILCSLIFIPVLVIAYLYPNIFLTALDYAGGFGCALLLGLIPILMVWSLRYGMKQQYGWKLPGGKPVLLSLTLFVVLELCTEIYHQFF